jgi:tellurite resistance protein
MGPLEADRQAEDAMTETYVAPDEAILAILAAVAQADGDTTVQEFPMTMRLAMSYARHAGYDKDRARDLMLSLMSRAREGMDAVCRAAVPAIPQDLRPSAFARAVEVAFLDGKSDAGEKEALQKLAKALGIPGELAQRIVDVIRVQKRWPGWKVDSF